MGLKDLASLFKRQPVKPTSDLHPLLKSNHPPNDQQVLEVCKRIQTLEAKYEKLTGSHWTPQPDPAHSRKASPLPSEAQKLDAHIRALRSILSPIRRIPHEVLQQIMIFVAESDQPRTVMGEEVVKIDSSKVFSPARVCRSWRNAALGTPHVWREPSNIYFDGDDMPEKERDAMLNDLRLHLRRSGALPIIFRLSRPGDYTADAKELERRSCEPIWKLLRANIARWGTVSLYGSLDLYDALRGEDAGKQFGELTDLSISLAHPWNWGGEPVTIDAFAEAPKLKNFSFMSRSMTYLSNNAPKLALSLPWHQLERYSTHGGGDNALENILRENPKGLLYLNYVVTNFYAEVPQHQLAMHKLGVLRAQVYNNASRLATLIDQLMLPSLVELELRGAFRQEDIIFTKVKNLIVRSGCSLRKLELDDADKDAHAFSQLISLTPTIEYLDIARPEKGMLTALILDPSSLDPVLPKLTSFTIEIGASNSVPRWTVEPNDRVYTCDVQILRALLKSRMQIVNPPTDSVHDADYFRPLREVRFACRDYDSNVNLVWDFQANLEGPSNVPGLSDERLREWQMCLMKKFASYWHPKKDFYNLKLHFTMNQFMKDMENFKVNSDNIQILCVRVSQFFCRTNADQ